MDQIKQRLDELIKETEEWRVFHKAHNNKIEAAACAIRIKALQDAISSLQSTPAAR